MNTQDRTSKAFSEIWEQEAQRKAKEQRRAKEKDAEAEKVLKEIRDLFPKKDLMPKDKKRTPISRVTPWGYDYDWVAEKAKRNE